MASKGLQILFLCMSCHCFHHGFHINRTDELHETSRLTNGTERINRLSGTNGLNVKVVDDG